MSGALAGRSALELASRYGAVALAGAELVAAGADMTLVEAPGGHPWRTREPTVDGTGVFFASTAAGKASTVLDLADPEAQARLVRAAAGADVVLAGDDAPAELLRALGNVTLLGVVSGWGNAGCRAGAPASEVTVQALSGYGNYLGTPGGAPRPVGADVAEHAACRLLVHGVLAALLASRGPETVTVSLLGAACALKTIMWAARTDPDAWEGFHLLAATHGPEHGWRTRDGAVTIDFLMGDEGRWRALMEEWGIADGFAGVGDRWTQTVGLGDDAPAFRPLYERATTVRSTQEVTAAVEAAGGLAAPYLGYDELLAHPQVDAERGTLADVNLDGRRLRRVRPVAHVERHEPAPAAVPALGTSALAAGRAAARGGEGDEESPPLTGVRILDFSQGAVGPWAGTLLARLGADVVKLDPPRGDFILAVGPRSHGRPTTYASLNVGKRCARCDARDPEQHRRVRSLIREADVLIENLRPGVMPRLGLGYEDVCEENPGIVYLSSTGYGQEGPLAASRCTDPQMQAFGGLATANRPDAPESLRYYAVIDMVTALAGAELVLLALLERARHGHGRWVTASMLHAGLTLQARQVAEHLAGGGTRARPATDGPLRALDGWLAVSAVDDGDFARLAAALRRPELADEPAFATERDRHEHAAQLRAALEAAVAERPRSWWLGRLSRAGVPAAPYLDDEAAAAHEQLHATGAVEYVPCGEAGPLTVSATPWTFARVRLGPAGAAPVPGGSDGELAVASDGWPA